MTEKIKGTGEGGKEDTHRKITDKIKGGLNFDRIWGTSNVIYYYREEEIAIKKLAIKKLKEMGEIK